MEELFDKTTVNQLLLLLMNNGNKKLSKHFSISIKTRNQFKLLRQISFKILDKSGALKSLEGFDTQSYKIILRSLTRSGQVIYFKQGAVFPANYLPRNSWISLSDEVILQFQNEFKKRQTPLRMATFFLESLLTQLNLVIKGKYDNTTHGKFAKRCNILLRYQKQRGGLIFRDNNQEYISFRWVHKFEHKFQTGDKNILNQTYEYLNEDLNSLILPISNILKGILY
jgi:hypothetical protein